VRTAAILPIKSFGAAKQRLGSLLGSGSRQALAQAMFQDVLASLRRVQGIERIVIVASEPSVEFAADEQVLLLEDDAQDGQSAAAAIGIRWALAEGIERVLMVPGDTPLLATAEIEALLEGAREPVVLVPDRHGTGTNALMLHPPDVIEPSFGPDSLRRHVAVAEAAEVAHRVERVPSLETDVLMDSAEARRRVASETLEFARRIAAAG
jgi:2-phospho-L-lactate guanylyltransferase